MTTGSLRQNKTFTYLMAVTLVSCVSIYFANYLPFAPLFHPVLFGMALAQSNRPYWRHRLSAIAIPVFFQLIFLWGTLPFYALADLIGGNRYVFNLFGCFGALLLVLITTKGLLKEMTLSTGSLVAILVLALAGVTTDAVITNHSFFQVEKNLVESEQRLALTVLLYQSLMSVLLVGSMKNATANNQAMAQPNLRSRF